MRTRQGARVIAVLSALSVLGACPGTPAATTASSAPPSSAVTESGTGAPRTVASTASPSAAPVSSSVSVAPECTAAALQESTNAGRSADSRLTVTDTDVHCQDAWAVVGANDLVNKAQYTFVFQWADGQWQGIPDRSAACAGQQIPAALYTLACRSN